MMKSDRLLLSGLLALALGLISSRPARAFEQGACQDDMKKYCSDAVKPGGSMGECMKSHEADLSPACKENMKEAKAKREAKMKEIKDACQADIKQFCANVTPGQGREIACLKSYDDKISAGCKAALPKMGMHHEHHGGGKGPGDNQSNGASQGGNPSEGGPAGGK